MKRADIRKRNEKILSDYRGGKSLKECAALHGLDQSNVSRIIRKHDATRAPGRRPGDPRNEGARMKRSYQRATFDQKNQE